MQRDYERSRHDGWADDDRDESRPRRRGVVSRVVSLLKLALVLTPIALFAASYLVTDCGSQGDSGLGGLFRAGACARGEIINGALSLPDNLGVLRRAMN